MKYLYKNKNRFVVSLTQDEFRFLSRRNNIQNKRKYRAIGTLDFQRIAYWKIEKKWPEEPWEHERTILPGYQLVQGKMIQINAYILANRELKRLISLNPFNKGWNWKYRLKFAPSAFKPKLP